MANPVTTLEIRPCGPIHASVRPPGSKSITNRALVCAALADGTTFLQGALASEDTQVMIDSLASLGISIEEDATRTLLRVAGRGGEIPVANADLYVGNSGTTVRFLTALATLGTGRYRLDGTPRMRQRPISDLLDALQQLGADVVSEVETGCPPVVIQGNGLAGGRADIRGSVSSQFLSALLLAAPYAKQQVELKLAGELVSLPYVEMTLAVMQAFGVRVERPEQDTYRVPNKNRYRGGGYEVEPDASAASYFFAAAAITGGRVNVDGLSRNSLQGDVRFCECLREMGCSVEYHSNYITVAGGPLRGVEVNMNAISDTVQTLSAVALFADGPTAITGVGHIRHKETDRIRDLARELRKLGAEVEELTDGLRITPRVLRPAEIDTYDDHRMAMSLALVGLGSRGIVIRDPGCVNKTYPEFFADLRRVCSGLGN